MAFTFSYTEPSTGGQYPSAYLKIDSVHISKTDKCAWVTISIYASEAARASGLKPVSTQRLAFNDWVDLQKTAHKLWSSVFAVSPEAVNPEPVNLDDIVLTQTYLSLKSHPQLASLLTSATAS